MAFPPAVHTPTAAARLADGATVAATAYVGPHAAVLGGVVEGQARLNEDYAIVWNGLVKAPGSGGRAYPVGRQPYRVG